MFSKIIPHLRHVMLLGTFAVVLGGCVTPLTGQFGDRSEESPKLAANLSVANSAQEAGDYRTAVRIYKNLLDANSNNMDVAEKLGTALFEIGAYHDAISTFKLVLASDHDNVSAIMGIGRSLLALHSPDQSLVYLGRARNLAPQSVTVLAAMGVANDGIGESSKAQMLYRKALEIDPDGTGVKSNLGLSLALSGDYDEAIEVLTDIAFTADSTARMRQNLSFAYGMKGDFTAAALIARTDLPEMEVQENIKYFKLIRKSGATGPKLGMLFDNENSIPADTH
ncbi:MAG: tetratricopeptide repeat protein [Sneathiella sp.]|nr:tetratricopeptide repeat protein [Sneathiella sp.]